MAINKRVASMDDALADLRDGMTVFISGFGGAGFPNALLGRMLELRHGDLTLVAHSAIHRLSRTHELVEAGLVRKIICTGARRPDGQRTLMDQLIADGKVEIELVPQGTFAERIRAGGAGIPGFYTAVAAGTKLAAGKETKQFDGREHILERAISGDLALIAADAADRFGNVSFRFTQLNFAAVMAAAAKLCVAQVRRFEEVLLLPDIGLPGVYVDRAVVVDESA